MSSPLVGNFDSSDAGQQSQKQQGQKRKRKSQQQREQKMEPTTTQRITRSMTQNKKGEEKEEKEKEHDNNRTRLAMKEKFEELEALEASNDAFVTNLTAQITDCPVRMKKASTLPVDLRDDDLNHPFWDPRFFMDPLLNDPSLYTELQLEADIEDVLDQLETSDALAPSPSS